MAQPAPTSKEPTFQLEHVEQWAKDGAKDDVSARFLEQCGISREVGLQALVWLDGHRLRVPTLDESGQRVLKVRDFVRGADGVMRTARGTGRGGFLYPTWLPRPEGVLTIVSSEVDVLALRSLGRQSAMTFVGSDNGFVGRAFADVLPTDPSGKVAVCTGTTFRKSREFVASLLGCGAHTVLSISGLGDADTIAEYLSRIPAGQRVAAWDALIAGAAVRTDASPVICGLIEENGALVSMDKGMLVAPFVGRVLTAGLERFGFDTKPRKVLEIELRHMRGGSLIVRHAFGESFAESIATTPGADSRWMIAERSSESVLIWLCQLSSGREDRRDIGWIFGFDNAVKETQWTRFYSKSCVFSAQAPLKNEELVMRGPGEMLDHLDLPMPDGGSEESRALMLTWRELVASHVPEFTMPMLAVSLLAPMRRKHWPGEPRFWTFCCGESGSGKTSRLRHFQNLFGFFPSDTMLLSWESTTRSLDKLLAFAGDSMVLIDEFPVLRSNPAEKLQLMRFLQGSTQGSGRYRLSQQGELQTPPEARCLPVLSMEALPLDDEALLARTLILKVPAIPLLDRRWADKWESVDKQLELLPYAMSAWVDFMMRESGRILVERTRADAKEDMDTMLASVRTAWRTSPNAMRVVSRLGTLTHVLYVFMAWLRSRALLTVEGEQNAKDSWTEQVLPVLVTSLVDSIKEAAQEESFLAAVASALQAGQAVLRYRESDAMEKQLPHYARSQASVIGEYWHEPTSVDAISLAGQRIGVALYSSASSVGGMDTLGSKWRTAVQFLVARGIAEPRSTHRGRMLYLTKKGALSLLGPIPGISSS